MYEGIQKKERESGSINKGKLKTRREEEEMCRLVQPARLNGLYKHTSSP